MKWKSRPLTCERLKDVLRYERRTGVFTWRKALSRRSHVGDVAGCVNKSGYRIIWIDGLRYPASRLAWLYVYKTWPGSDTLDHKDRVRSNDAIGNLREASYNDNARNCSMLPTNTSGFRGVSRRSAKYLDRWRAAIRIGGGKRLFLGDFDSPGEAAAAYATAAQKHHGNFNGTGGKR